MHYNVIKTAAGARTRLRLPMLWKADAVAAEELPEAVFWVFIGGERVRVEKTPGSDDEYIFPALQAGQYAWDLVVDAQVVLHGVLKVRGSAVPPGGGEVCGTLLVDAPAMVLVLSPGPRGEVGPVGPQGLSAYEVALQYGYEGSEDKWAAELSGAQAAATAAKEQATEAGKQATAASNSATAAGKAQTAAESAAGNAEQAKSEAKSAAGEAGTSAAAAATQAGNAATSAAAAATQAGNAAASATAAATQAGNAAASATAAGESATQAATQAGNAATSATAAGESATKAATQAGNAAASATAAASTLAAAAKLADNNTFSGVNTFNGSLVANGPTKLTAQTTVDGTSMQDLLEMQTALSSFLAGIGELSLETQLQPGLGCHAETWDEWTAVNPNWAQQDTLVFYAPFAATKNAVMTSNANITSRVTRSIWISPMLPAILDSPKEAPNIIKKALGSNISLYCTARGTLSGVMNLYNAKKVTVITPYATVYDSFISCIGFITSASNNAMHIYAPELQSIANGGNINATFYYMPILAEFSIYAPKLTTSFYFSYATNHDTDGDGYVQGQTCAVLQALIAGIGKPATEQTITTATPQGTADEIAALDAAAAAKNWKFEYVKVKK